MGTINAIETVYNNYLRFGVSENTISRVLKGQYGECGKRTG